MDPIDTMKAKRAGSKRLSTASPRFAWPSFAKPSFAKPSLARPTFARPTFARPSPAHARPAPWPALLFALGACATGSSPTTSTTVAPAASDGMVVRQAATFTTLASEQVSLAALDYPKIEDEGAAPLSLTATDGTGLHLRSLRAQAVVEGPLAFTQLHLTFENPHDRVIEGHFSITLPPNAAISRFAMKIGALWQEAEVVERQRARQVYEDFLHRKQDPALLENAAGNQFGARVFPIPARGEKELLVSFSHELERADDGYRLPLLGLPQIDDVQVRVLRKDLIAGAKAGSWTGFQHRDHKPEADFALPAPEAGASALKNGKMLVARVTPNIDATPEPIASALILFDTSASRAPGFLKHVVRLRELVTALGAADPATRVEVATFDNDVEAVYEGPAVSFGTDATNAILARRPLGASNLAGALRWAGERKRHDRLVLMTDAIATLGETDQGGLAQLAKTLPMTRIDAVLVGGIRDDAVASALTRGTRPRDGIVATGEESPARIATRLMKTTVSGIEVAVDGAELVWPRTLDGVQPGDTRLVYAVLNRESAKTTLQLRGAVEQAIPLAPAVVEAPLLARAIAKARIASLTAAKAALPPEARAQRQALRDEIIRVSTQHRVLSDETALLVLETEADYARFEIDRRSLVDVLAIDANGVTTIARGDVVTIAPEPRAPREDLNAFKDAKKDAGKLAERDGRSDDSSGGLGDSLVGGADQAPGRPARVESAPDASVARGRVEINDRPTGGAGQSAGARHGRAASERERRVREERPAPSSPRARAPSPATTEEASSGAGAELEMADADEIEAPSEPLRQRSRRRGAAPINEIVAKPQMTPAYTGRMATLMGLLGRKRIEEAIVESIRWRNDDPGDVMALIGMGEALEAAEKKQLAARAYASIIDLFPSRADLRRFAGQRLERLGAESVAFAVDSLERAVEQRPDHLTGHRQLAYAYVRAGRLADAFEAIETGLRKHNHRAQGGEQILREDLGVIGAAWIAREPVKRSDVEKRLKAVGSSLPRGPSTRFVLSWETDANDVDFHIFDAAGGHAYYSKRELPSGGRLYADVTNGYGPECFTIEGKPEAAPYEIQIHYYSRGPMGYGMGELEILEHDGAGGLRLESRPFVVMNDGAYVHLGTIGGPPEKG